MTDSIEQPIKHIVDNDLSILQESVDIECKLASGFFLIKHGYGRWATYVLNSGHNEPSIGHNDEHIIDDLDDLADDLYQKFSLCLFVLFSDLIHNKDWLGKNKLQSLNIL